MRRSGPRASRCAPAGAAHQRHRLRRSGAARYKEGVGGLIDLLAAENALADARAQRIQARLLWYSALVQLAHDAALLDPDGGARIRLSEPTDSTK